MKHPWELGERGREGKGPAPDPGCQWAAWPQSCCGSVGHFVECTTLESCCGPSSYTTMSGRMSWASDFIIRASVSSPIKKGRWDLKFLWCFVILKHSMTL